MTPTQKVKNTATVRKAKREIAYLAFKANPQLPNTIMHATLNMVLGGSIHDSDMASVKAAALKAQTPEEATVQASDESVWENLEKVFTETETPPSPVIATPKPPNKGAAVLIARGYNNVGAKGKVLAVGPSKFPPYNLRARVLLEDGNAEWFPITNLDTL